MRARATFSRLSLATLLAVFSLVCGAFDATPASAQALPPLVYSVSLPAPESHVLEIEATVPADSGQTFELMMPIWSPGYYRIEDYAANVSDVRARTTDGRTLEVERTQKNRWRIHGGGSVVVSYRVFCNQRSVTTNYVGAGDTAAWDADGATADLKTFVEETHRFWGFLPYDKYVFLLAFRQGGGGLEHMNSTLSTVSPNSREGPATERGRWVSLGLLAHEYFHLFNAKRPRPVELGPFDFEQSPTTGSLWIAEGVTSYYSDLLLTRSGLRTPDQRLASISNLIGGLQSAPGRLLQSVEQSSLQVWQNSNSGVNPNATTVSYYNKGNVLGLLLDARIRKVTRRSRSLDDVMKLAYRRYSGDRGYTADEFRAVAQEIAGTSLREWFTSAVSSTEELDYTDVLEWYGLRFTTSTGRAGAWQIERRPDATDVQKRNLAAWLR